MNIKRLISLTGIVILVLSTASSAAAVSGPVIGQDEGPSPLWPATGPVLFLPFVQRAAPVFTLSGQVKDAEDLPLAGVTVEVDGGLEAVTNDYGVYKLSAPEGDQTIIASKEGYSFEPGTADVEVAGNLNNLNFSAVSTSAPSVDGCTNLLLNSNFESTNAWVIRNPTSYPAVKSRYTSTYWFSPVFSMLSGTPVGDATPYPGEWTTGEFYQPTSAVIPATATVVQLQMRLLPRSTDLWGYHIEEQAALDAAIKLNLPDATESQYGFVCTDGSDTDTCNPDNGGKMLFKWFPIDSYYWLYRSYDLRDFRGKTISILFGATNDGYNGNTALYVDDVYLYYCMP